MSTGETMSGSENVAEANHLSKCSSTECGLGLIAAARYGCSEAVAWKREPYSDLWR